MKKTLITIALIGVANIVSAESEVCRYSTEYNVDIDANRVLFSRTNGERYEFAGDKLLINNKGVELTKAQKEASLSLQKKAREMVPQIAEVAIEGAELGIKTATMVITSLFGDDKAAQTDLIKPIEVAVDKIKTNITKTQLNVEAVEKVIEDGFDEEFEQVLETAITKYSGKIVGNVLSSVFSGDSEELKDLEFRMENLEHDIEQYVEVNAKELEEKANLLCSEMVAMDSYDSVLESVDGYPKGGLFFKGEPKDYKFKGLNIKK
ncbi:DUF2884 family protein [Aliikangiella sp. IMCC44359]|uniref:DUF2884 family protein n=1 Tax=Aliikangiella sp. IMCC44359 TaxID=3459125 RepID=UPI00403ACC6D